MEDCSLLSCVDERGRAKWAWPGETSHGFVCLLSVFHFVLGQWALPLLLVGRKSPSSCCSPPWLPCRSLRRSCYSSPVVLPAAPAPGVSRSSSAPYAVRACHVTSACCAACVLCAVRTWPVAYARHATRVLCALRARCPARAGCVAYARHATRVLCVMRAHSAAHVCLTVFWFLLVTLGASSLFLCCWFMRGFAIYMIGEAWEIVDFILFIKKSVLCMLFMLYY